MPETLFYGTGIHRSIGLDGVTVYVCCAVARRTVFSILTICYDLREVVHFRQVACHQRGGGNSRDQVTARFGIHDTGGGQYKAILLLILVVGTVRNVDAGRKALHVEIHTGLQ